MTTKTELLREVLHRVTDLLKDGDALGASLALVDAEKLIDFISHQPEQPAPQGCAECGKTSAPDSMWALFCVDCMQEHGLGAMPWIELVQELLPEGIEDVCDECGGMDAQCPTGCTYRKARAMLAASPTPPQAEQAEAVEMSPEFTDTARAALLWVLWHHQGSACKVGQPLRFALGMGQHERMNEHQVREAKRWGELAAIETAKPPKVTWPITEEEKQFHEQHSGAAKPDIRPRAADAQPLTDEQKRDMWKRSDFRGSGGQYEWYLQGIEEAERAHGITGKDNAS